MAAWTPRYSGCISNKLRSDDLSDDMDISRQCQYLMYAQANMLTVSLVCALFQSRLDSSKPSSNLAHNDGMRLMLKLLRWASASQMFVSVGVPTCHAIFHNLMHSCMCSVKNSRM